MVPLVGLQANFMLAVISAIVLNSPCRDAVRRPTFLLVNRRSSLRSRYRVIGAERRVQMDVQEAIALRRSVRSYGKDRVEPEKLRLVLTAANLAPSARNEQNRHLIVVRNKETLTKLAHACNQQMHVAEADTVICCCVPSTRERAKPGLAESVSDLTVSVGFMMLQATELGLGTCWIGDFDPRKVRALLRIPETVYIHCLLTLGYPHFIPPPSDRKELSEIVSEESYGTPLRD